MVRVFEIVGGDAHIAPQHRVRIRIGFRRIRTMYRRADVGIGPYEVREWKWVRGFEIVGGGAHDAARHRARIRMGLPANTITFFSNFDPPTE